MEHSPKIELHSFLVTISICWPILLFVEFLSKPWFSPGLSLIMHASISLSKRQKANENKIL